MFTKLSLVWQKAATITRPMRIELTIYVLVYANNLI